MRDNSYIDLLKLKRKMRQDYTYTVFADYFMIFVYDEATIPDDGDLDITNDDIKAMCFPAPGGGFVIGTVRNMNVPLHVSIVDHKPEINHSEYDHVVECGIDINSGVLSINGTTDYIGDYRKISVENGIYNGYILYSKLGSLWNNDLDGDDSYHLVLWKDNMQAPIKVLKQYDNPAF